MIRTVLGDIPAGALGHAQCHEHLLVAESPASETFPALKIDEPEKSLRELIAYRAAGGGAVVDAQPVFAGRMARGLVELSLYTGVHVVAVTGFHKRMFYPADCPLFAMDAETLSALFIKEITDGMLDGSLSDRIPARAGLVKIAFDSSVAGGLDRTMASAAIEASRSTGAPLIVHTEPDCDVLGLVEATLNAGLSASKLIVCHMDRTCRDLSVHRAVLETGAYLNYDSIHRFKYISAEEELALIRTMLDAGYGRQLLISLDTTAARMEAYGGSIGLDYILRHYRDELRSGGVLPQDIRAMTADNAANALNFD